MKAIYISPRQPAGAAEELARRPVTDVMSSPVTSVSADMSALQAASAVVGPQAKVLDVARLMRSAGVDAVAVAEADGQPIGIVTGTDLVALLAR
jgi:CBS domain-containing protein